MLNIMKKYQNAFSVSGFETQLANIIIEDIKDKVDSIETDALGNVIALKKGKDSSKKLMIAAHMDEIGFMVVNIESNGMLRVANIGGINAIASSYHNVKFQNGVNGILVVEDGTKAADINSNKLFVDIGCDTAEKAKRKVSVGDVCAVSPMIKKLSSKRYTSKAFDDRICCTISTYAALNCDTPAYDTYFVYTVQEEVGCRGAKPSSFAIMPDYSIAMDITPAPACGNPNHFTVKLGGGAAIKIKDSSVICSPTMVDRLTELAKENDIKYQYEVLLAGGTDTSQMQIAGSGSHACCISIPTRYTHSPVETIDIDDLYACAKLLIAFIEKGM
ncbi:MAG: M42 family metallopeptidase [Clostridia bacterium]|nr:M42 family metallopeptidase [Clostridia bacterium]